MTAAVSVHDLAPGTVTGAFLDGPRSVELLNEFPLGRHKLALGGIAAGTGVVEIRGVLVAVVSQRIGKGEYVHTPNIRGGLSTIEDDGQYRQHRYQTRGDALAAVQRAA